MQKHVRNKSTLNLSLDQMGQKEFESITQSLQQDVAEAKKKAAFALNNLRVLERRIELNIE